MLYKSDLYEIEIVPTGFDVYQEFDKDFNPCSNLVAQDAKWKVCHLRLNASSFGLATNTFWRFWITYDSSHANWNFEKPKLPEHCETPFSILRSLEITTEDTIPAPKMKPGYRSKDMQRYKDRDFPNGYIKLAWQYPCPHITPKAKYVHPGEDRLLTKRELEALYGCKFGETPLSIQAYLEKHISFFVNKSWGSQNFEGLYDRFANKWKINHFANHVPFIKHFDFSSYTPPPLGRDFS